MNPITHHPTEETLAAFASGTLDEGRSVVVAVHASLCPACNGKTRRYEAIGGVLLDQTSPAAMKPDALQKVLGLIDTNLPAPIATPEEPLDRYQLGKWRWVWPGVRQRSISVPVVSNIKVFMLKAEPGIQLPHHKHTGYEWTCVLEGAFEHQFGRYGPGDFDEADETLEHKPTICQGATCVCIVALQGNIKFQSGWGRMIQPLLRL
ncbi:ChrR family anti-sigma-E factor [Mesorhizobium sp. B2-1-3A]|uniref:ChrR family anti-sigma-E factor n=1 Tax=Mesorhizobium sp. B2-1-3A TaxID=2589971 RepID=UPI00112795A8|nr:ChrR family anti-sigma-E factor [Mesorhizobium sp. B2-1-3A]TPM95000.1 anti-sigma factor [Mesorhizobium sp. B2-1-3A]